MGNEGKEILLPYFRALEGKATAENEAGEWGVVAHGQPPRRLEQLHREWRESEKEGQSCQPIRGVDRRARVGSKGPKGPVLVGGGWSSPCLPAGWA